MLHRCGRLCRLNLNRSSGVAQTRCRLIRGFTHPMTYFSSGSAEMELHTVEQFSAEIVSVVRCCDVSRKTQ